MNKNNKMILPAFAVVAALSSLGSSQTSFAKKGQEKCYGIAKAGENACGSSDGRHGCHGAATKDYDKTEWKWVDEGTCEAEQKKVAALTNAENKTEAATEKKTEASKKMKNKAKKKAKKNK